MATSVKKARAHEKKLTRLLIALTLTFFCALPALAQVPDVLAPDLIIHNGKIVTVDDTFSIQEALAVKDGKIIAVDNAEKILALKGADTRLLDLKGNTLLPGINDSHMHLPWYVTANPPYQLNMGYPNVKSIEDMRALVKAAANELPPGAWIVGTGYNDSEIGELAADPSRQLSKHDFDDVAPDNPVYIVQGSFHNAVANSRALELAGVTRDTPDPDGGTVVRDPQTGEPTGYFVEKARNLIEAVKPPYTREQMKTALLDNVKYLSALGITSVTTAAETPFEVNIYSEIAARNAYPLRLNVLLMWADYGLGGSLDDFKAAMRYVGTTSGFGSDRLKIGGVKIFADGVPPTFTAWAYDPYPDGTYGGLVVPGKTDAERTAELFGMIRFCHEQGFQMGIHATGDRAVAVTVEGLAQALRDKPWDARHYIIHGDWIPEDTRGVMAANHIGLSTQTAIKYGLADEMTKMVGAERSGEQFPLKSMLKAGVVVCNSSDAPVVSPDWRIGLQTAVLREGKQTGEVSGPQERVTLKEALRTYTIYPAWLEHAETVKGSVEPGKFADFCIIGQDITTIDPHEIMDIPILMTILDGEVVFSDETLRLQ